MFEGQELLIDCCDTLEMFCFVYWEGRKTFADSK